MRKLVAAALFLVGCVDPNADLDAFRNRLPEGAISDAGLGAPDGAACTVHPGDIEGKFLLAISVSLAPGKPILSLVDVASPASDGGTGITFDAQPLSAADRTTPVGQSVVLGPFTVDAQGILHADIPGLTVAGEANPITPGAGITADLTLTGRLCPTSSFYCGTASGQATKPLMLDLTGSTFTLTAIETDGGIPVQPKIDCRGTLADPL